MAKKKDKHSAQSKMAADIVAKEIAHDKKQVGRPSLYTEELANEICQRIAHGELLKNICMDDHMPNRTAVYDWLYAHEKFYNAYARARAQQSDFWAEQCIELADAANDADYSAAQRLKVDTRKWLAGKIRPRVWGDDATGFDGAEKSSEGGATKRLIERLKKSRDKRSTGSSGSSSGDGGT